MGEDDRTGIVCLEDLPILHDGPTGPSAFCGLVWLRSYGKRSPPIQRTDVTWLMSWRAWRRARKRLRDVGLLEWTYCPSEKVSRYVCQDPASPPYGCIPITLLPDLREMGLTACLVYGAASALGHLPQTSKVAEMIGPTKRSIRRAVRRLTNAGLLELLG